MAIRKYKPTTPGRRGSSVADFAEITRSTPEKSLLRPLHEQGRPQRLTAGSPPATRAAGTSASTGSSTSSGSTRTACRPRSRTSSTTRTGPPASRCCTTPTARSATSSRRRTSSRATRSSRVRARTSSRATTCRCATSRSAPQIHAVELRPGGGAKLARSAGVGIQLLGREGRLRDRCACRRARSGGSTCAAAATVGEIGNADQSNINWGKAGRMRWKGKRPTVRGVAHEPGRPPARRW